MMYKIFKFRLYPDKEKLDLLNKSFRSLQFVYNDYLFIIKNNGYRNIKYYVNNLKY